MEFGLYQLTRLRTNLFYRFTNVFGVAVTTLLA